jgi:16S rRNA processing protein RimM
VFGRVVKPHGLAGDVAVEILTDFPHRFRPGLSLVLRTPEGELRPARIASVRAHGRRALVRFDGVDGPEAAEALRGVDLCALPGDVPERPEGFVFHWEVEGCEAVDASGRRLGRVKELVDVGGRALLTIETTRGPRDVPFSYPIVTRVDLKGKRIVLDPPVGLLD